MTATAVAPAKTNALNIGAGQGALANWLHVDMGAWPVGVKADARALPFRDGQFLFIHCSHLIEHVPRKDAPTLLRELRRVQHPDGFMFISAPDMVSAKNAGSIEWTVLTATGGWRPGWEHKWSCDTPTLRHLLIEAGFVPTWAGAIPTGWPANTHSWPSEFEARFVCRRNDYPWPKAFPTGVQVIL